MKMISLGSIFFQSQLFKAYFCLAMISGLICDRVVRPTDEGASSFRSLGTGLLGAFVRLDLLKVGVSIPDLNFNDISSLITFKLT